MKIFISVLLCLTSHLLYAQLENNTEIKYRERLTLDEVITLATQRSLDASSYKYQFLTSYWQFRAYKAELLPSLNLNLTLPNFSHSISTVQNYETGEYNYVQNYYMRNYASLSINQNIAATGGTLALSSSLERLDQFQPRRYHRYTSNPISMIYYQPIFGNFNNLKWSKIIEPQSFEKAKLNYLENIENIKLRAVNLFFNLISCQLELQMEITNYTNTRNSYQTAQERFRIGKITQNDLLQLEVNMLNAELRITQNEISTNKARAELASYLGYPQGEVEFELIIPMEIPEIFLDPNFVYDLSLNNTSYKIDQKLKLLNAEMEVARAKANRGTSVSLDAQFGLNKTSESFSGTYKHPEDYEVVRLGIQVPIMDWGLGKGRVKTKKSNLDLVESQVQDLIDYERETKIKVYEFNNQRMQCLISEKANNIAQQRYELAVELFNKGSLSVTEFNTAQTEKDNATNTFINQIYKFWSYYYTLQKSTLYDFMKNRNITTDFDLLIEN